MFTFLLLLCLGGLVVFSLYLIGMVIVVLSKDNELPDYEDVIV